MSIVQDLYRLLGRSKVIDDPGILRLYAKEPSGLEGRGAVAVVFPENTEDVRKIVEYAYREEIPIYPQGSSTSLSGSAVPFEKGIVISMERMRKIHEVNIVDGVAIVEPGIRIDDLNIELARYGYMFPVDPASSSVATVGGAINTGAGGMRGAKYGTMRDWVLGLELVLADDKATLLRIGCRTVKCRQGYDLTRLIIGSEGTLGIVTKAILRITPLPEQVVYILAFYDKLEDLAATVVDVKSNRIVPLISEFLEARTVEIAKKLANVELEAEGHMLLLGVDVYKESAERMVKLLTEIAEKNNAKKIYTAWSTEEAEEKGLFAIRKNLFTAGVYFARQEYGKDNVQVLIEDIVVPPSKLVEAVKELRELTEKKYGLTLILGGHIGDGNLHPEVGLDPEDEEAKKRVEEWYLEVMKLALKLGGSISAEHGIGVLKKKGLMMEAEAIGSPKMIKLMERIKRVFDPKNILNPGKVV